MSKLHANFFWGDNAGNKKEARVAWQRVYKPVERVLGISDLHDVKKCLHMKLR